MNWIVVRDDKKLAILKGSQLELGEYVLAQCTSYEAAVAAKRLLSGAASKKA